MVRAQVGFRCLAVRQAARRSWRSSSRAAEACRDNRTAQPRGGERRAENYTSPTMHVVVGRKDMPPRNLPQDLVQRRVAPEAHARGDAALRRAVRSSVGMGAEGGTFAREGNRLAVAAGVRV